MPISKARRAANDKWDKENMTTLGCKVKKEEAAAFKEYAARNGKTSNNMLKDYVIECISDNKAMERDNEINCQPGDIMEYMPDSGADGE